MALQPITWTVLLRDPEFGSFSTWTVKAVDQIEAMKTAVAFYANLGVEYNAITAYSSELPRNHD